MTDSVTERTEREDFQATSDPALLESADRGEVNLLSYRQLYALWERQQWRTQDIDFSQDRIDWHERIPPRSASSACTASPRSSSANSELPRSSVR